MSPDNDSKGKWIRELVNASNLGFEFAAFILFGAYIGNYLDRRWHTNPWMLLTGFLLGMIMSFYRLYDIIRKGE